MHRIQLTTFLKLLLQTTQEKARSYRRYDEPGGYDFYQSFKRSAEGLTIKGRSLERAARSIQTLNNPVERQHNLAALEGLHRWLGKSRMCFEPPSGIYRSPSKTLGIMLKPELARSMRGERQVIAVWNTKDVAMNRTVAGVGIFMMQSKLKTGSFADCSFHLLDLTDGNGRLYGPASIPNHAHALLAAEFAVADELLKHDDAA